MWSVFIKASADVDKGHLMRVSLTSELWHLTSTYVNWELEHWDEYGRLRGEIIGDVTIDVFLEYAMSGLQSRVLDYFYDYLLGEMCILFVVV